MLITNTRKSLVVLDNQQIQPLATVEVGSTIPKNTKDRAQAVKDAEERVRGSALFRAGYVVEGKVAAPALLTLAEMKIPAALLMVEGETDKAILQQWLESDTRGVVKSAIERQIKG